MTSTSAALSGRVDRLAEFAAGLTWANLPTNVQERALLAVLDFAITARAGAGTETTRVAMAALDDLGESGACHAAGSTSGWAPRAAAFLNGTAAFSQNFGDTSFHTILHGTPSVIPASLAAAEHHTVTGVDLLASIVVGYEVAERFGRALNDGTAALGHYRRGFHTTGTCGALGAAAATARCIGMTAESVLNTLCVTATYASGLRGARSVDAEAIPLWTHGGHAAATGVLGTALARAGLRADVDALVGPHGLFAALGGSSVDEEALVRSLGDAFGITDYAVKLFPVGHLLIPTIEAMLTIRARTGWMMADEIALRVPDEHLRIGNLDVDPRSFSRAQSSFPFIAALALLDGDVTAEGIHARLGDPRLVALGRTVSTSADTELTRLAETEHVWAARARVRHDGELAEASAGPPRGSPQVPVGWAEMRQKASRMAGLAPAFISAAEAAVRSLPAARDVQALMRVLTTS